MVVFISILIFLTVSLAIFGFNNMSRREKDSINKRLDNITQEFREETTEADKIRPKLDFSNLLSTLGKSFVSMSFTKKMENQLSKADILLRVEEFIGLNILTTIGGGLLGLLLFAEGTPTFIMAFLGLMAPWLFLYRQKKVRAALLNNEIGDSLTGMSNSLRAGYSFQQAMDLVSKETVGPLAVEYRRTLREINLGITTEQALQNLVERADNEDLELMIGAVLIQRQIGGNLAEIFDNIADTIRQRIRMKGEVKTLTAQGRISGMIIGLLPIGLFIILMMINPHYMGTLVEKPLGWYLMGGALVSEVIGFIFIRSITNIEF